MNHPSAAPEFLPALARDLREHLGCCETALALATEENRALNTAGDFQPFEFHQKRTRLLAGLDASLLRLRTWRQAWQQAECGRRSAEGGTVGSRPPNSELRTLQPLFQAIQDLLMRVLMLDRENQQALLRRGLVPPKHLSLAAGTQPSHYVSTLYRRHAAAG